MCQWSKSKSSGRNAAKIRLWSAQSRRLSSALKKQAAHGYIMDVENRQLKQQLVTAKRDCAEWQTRYRDLRNDVQPYLDALRHAPERVRNFFENLLSQKSERTASISKDRHHEQNAEL